MNVYDHAHSLARAIRESEECRGYINALQKLKEDKAAFDMLLDFRKEQLELQKRKLSGEDIAGQEEKLAKLYDVINLNIYIRDFLASEYRFARMMADIEKILAEAVGVEGID